MRLGRIDPNRNQSIKNVLDDPDFHDTGIKKHPPAFYKIPETRWHAGGTGANWGLISSDTSSLDVNCFRQCLRVGSRWGINVAIASLATSRRGWLRRGGSDLSVAARTSGEKGGGIHSFKLLQILLCILKLITPKLSWIKGQNNVISGIILNFF